MAQSSACRSSYPVAGSLLLLHLVARSRASTVVIRVPALQAATAESRHLRPAIARRRAVAHLLHADTLAADHLPETATTVVVHTQDRARPGAAGRARTLAHPHPEAEATVDARARRAVGAGAEGAPATAAIAATVVEAGAGAEIGVVGIERLFRESRRQGW